jgi:ATP/ADP translocase
MSAPTEAAPLAPVATQDALADERTHTRSRAIGVASSLFLMTAAFILVKTGRDALYFQGHGLLDLPMAYIGLAILSLPAAMLVLGSIRLFGPRAARIIVTVSAAAILAAFVPFARPGGGALMTTYFMLVPLLFGVLFSLTWLLASDLLDGTPNRELARLYSIVGAASILGGVAGGGAARVAARHVEPQALIIFGAGVLVASALATAFVQARFPQRALAAATPESRVQTTTVWEVLRERYSCLLLAVGMLTSLVGILIEFQFYLHAATSGMPSRTNAEFFASVYLALNAIALAVQLVVMPRLQRIVGVQGNLLVLPSALAAGAAGLLANASVAMRSFLRVAEGGLKSSIHRVSWEQAYLPMSRAHRAVAKLLVDGAGARIAEGAAALALYIWIRGSVGPSTSLLGRDTTWVTYLLLAITILWVILTRALGRRLAPVLAEVGDREFRPDIPLPDT